MRREKEKNKKKRKIRKLTTKKKKKKEKELFTVIGFLVEVQEYGCLPFVSAMQWKIG